eukprot:CAMPEP_0196739682 /NCGR_PEP_ID=MMETSP1091-20130531/24821_1 /TAXON_ID=302021 /ORGANISM="Rhodomonas sp., Strain CCMP768" /LENGTH=63 /DNA_ID=CAMNT_0042084363 /DNA_START=27 /DNA_END=215 /DNA_ORIENTATION=-
MTDAERRRRAARLARFPAGRTTTATLGGPGLTGQGGSANRRHGWQLVSKAGGAQQGGAGRQLL